MYDHWFCKECGTKGFLASDLDLSAKNLQAVIAHRSASPDCPTERRIDDTIPSRLYILNDSQVFRSSFGFDIGRDAIVQFHAARVIPFQMELIHDAR
jgi:hypothetical protein